MTLERSPDLAVYEPAELFMSGWKDNHKGLGYVVQDGYQSVKLNMFSLVVKCPCTNVICVSNKGGAF